jgi:hypothetical protein
MDLIRGALHSQLSRLERKQVASHVSSLDGSASSENLVNAQLDVSGFEMHGVFLATIE